MKYLLLIYRNEQELDESWRDRHCTKAVDLANDIHLRGQYLAAAPLLPVATAKSIRVRGGKTLVTDGPFAETREHLGGYFLVDTETLEDAIGIAARIPGARIGTVEIRPLLEIEGLPEIKSPVREVAASGVGRVA
jgi:hypothetical protein